MKYRLLSLIENSPDCFHYCSSLEQRDVRRWPFALLASDREEAEAALAPYGNAIAGIIVTFGTELSWLQCSEFLFHFTVPPELRANLSHMLHSHLVLLEICQQAENRNKVQSQDLARSHIDSQRNKLEFALIKESLLEELSERRRAEEELVKQKNLFSTIIESTSEAVFAKDTDGKYITINEAGARMLGFRATEVIGHTDKELLPAETASEFRNTDESITSSGQSYKREEIVTIGGRTYAFLSHKAPWRDNSGKIIGVIGVTNDISERKQAEEALRESEEKYRAMVEGFDGYMYICSKEFRIQFMNDKLIQRTGRNATGEYCYEALHDLESACEWCVNEQVITGKSVHWELKSPKDGRWYEINNSPIYNANGTISKQAMITDITVRKLAEEEKVILEAQLQQAQKMESVGRLAGGVAHDFNNMLCVIIGHAELALLKVSPSQPLFYNLKEMRKAAERSADLTRQLLAFARKQTVAPKVLDLNEAVTGMLNMLQRLIGEDIHLSWQPEANLWPVKVDSSQIDQILANLCVNARDAISEVGKIIIMTRNSNLDAGYCAAHAGCVPGEYVQLDVSDDGCGMDEETLTHIFEPFFTTKEMGKGTGLGLATVYGIVKQNNGFITADSETGQGTTFKIYLPRHKDETGQARSEEAEVLVVGGQETILLVEDEPAILDMITMMLEIQGYNVLQANTPGKAIILAGEHLGKIQLLLTDVVMPEMNGRDLANKLLSLYPNLKYLFMSGYPSNVIAHQGVLDEGVNFIQKPFTLQVLATKVRKVLESK